MSNTLPLLLEHMEPKVAPNTKPEYGQAALEFLKTKRRYHARMFDNANLILKQATEESQRHFRLLKHADKMIKHFES